MTATERSAVLAAMLAAGLTTACAGTTEPLPPPVETVVIAPAVPDPAPPSAAAPAPKQPVVRKKPPARPAEPEQKQAGGSEREPRAGDRVAGSAEAPSQPAEPARPLPSQDQVVGLTPPETAHLLGQPRSQEEKGPAKIWHYTADGCRMSVFFYPELATLKFRALRIEVEGAAAQEGRGCFEEIVVAARGRA